MSAVKARFVTICVTDTEAEAIAEVRAGRDVWVRGQGAERMTAALENPHVGILLSLLADEWDNTPAEDDGEGA